MRHTSSREASIESSRPAEHNDVLINLIRLYEYSIQEYSLAYVPSTICQRLD